MTNLQFALQKESDTTEYYKSLIQQSEQQRYFLHDTKKHLQSIALLNERGEREKIDTYIQQLVASSKINVPERICGNDFLNALLSRYVTRCSELGISFHPDIRSDACNGMNENELTALFCNLLDNAVEAASKVSDSCIDLAVFTRDENAFTVITLANSCLKNPLVSSGRFLSTTKSDSFLHGYGLKIISRIVSLYNGEMQYHYTPEDQMFHIIILLRTA